MAIPFPLDDVPNQRKLTPGQHPVQVFYALNKAEYPVLQGDRMTGAEVSASWPALPDSRAWLAIRAWEQSYSGVYDVQIPPGLLLGIELDGEPFPSYLNWTIAEMPEIESIGPGLSSLSLKMRGRMLGVGNT